jgi:hypothetical protein
MTTDPKRSRSDDVDRFEQRDRVVQEVDADIQQDPVERPQQSKDGDRHVIDEPPPRADENAEGAEGAREHPGTRVGSGI